MKRSIKNLMGFAIGATDGEIGKVIDFYFDDGSWTIRYLIVKTGSWLFGRKVLISPKAIVAHDWENGVFPANLLKEQVKNSPVIDTDKPISRQHELEIHAHYPWGTYWGNDFITDSFPPPISMYDVLLNEESEGIKVQGDPHLRSTEKVTGYKINADYGDIGKVEDFIIDDATWKIEFIVVDTGNLLPGKKVLISPNWIKNIVWENSEVTVNATIASVKNSPEYDPNQALTDEYVASLQKYYETGINKYI
jgi:uncharacterized protein YrrD